MARTKWSDLFESQRFLSGWAMTAIVLTVFVSGALASDTDGFQIVNLTTWFNNGTNRQTSVFNDRNFNPPRPVPQRFDGGFGVSCAANAITGQ